MDDKTTKVCHDCKQIKLLTEFAHTKTGHYMSYCKECRKTHDKKYRDSEKGKQKIKEYHKAYGRTTQRKAYVKTLNHRPDMKQKQKIRMHKYNVDPKNKIKHAAQQKARYAIKTGKLLKDICFICGKSNTKGHHPNYNNPLYIVFLCDDCHHNINKILKYVNDHYEDILINNYNNK
jgi:hypothetical protein